jgi:hypothetical protein
LRREHDHRVRRRQIGERGGDEDGGRSAVHRSEWANPVHR